MATLTIKGCRPTHPPFIFLWRRPTIKPTRPQPEPATYLDREALTAAALDLDKIPQELKDRPQWVAHRPDKTPVNPQTGSNAMANEPETWGE